MLSESMRFDLQVPIHVVSPPRLRNAVFPSRVPRRFQYNGGQSVRQSRPSSKSVEIDHVTSREDNRAGYAVFLISDTLD
jgi:hypothetical protein